MGVLLNVCVAGLNEQGTHISIWGEGNNLAQVLQQGGKQGIREPGLQIFLC